MNPKTRLKAGRNRYIYLSEKKVLVDGAKYSLIIDFKEGGLHRLNSSAREILHQCQKGVSIEKYLAMNGLDDNYIDSFIKNLLNKNLANIVKQPQLVSQEATANDSPQLNFLWIEVTSRCNLRCIHCYAESHEEPTYELNTASIIDWLNQAFDLGCRKIQFTGGECTLRKDLPELISFARKKGFVVIEIFTNATLLDESMIQFLLKNKIRVAVSLYSYKASTHDHICGIPGSHKKTIESLKLLLAHGVKVRGSIIAMKQNEKEIKATEFFLSELGAPSGPADPIRPCGRGRSMENWPNEYGRCIIRKDPCFFPEQTLYNVSRYWNSCWFGKAAISATADVMPCVFARQLVAGNLERHSLRNIVNDGLTFYWKLNRDKVSVCRDCEYRYICRDCRPWAYGYSGDLYAKTPTCTYNPYQGEWGKTETALNEGF